MNWNFLFLNALCLLSPMLVLGSGGGGTLKIAGRMASDMHIDHVKITYCEIYYGYSYFWSEAPTEKTAVVDGRFEFKLPVIGAYQYVKFEFMGSDKKLPVIRRLSAPLFFTPTDAEISLDIISSDSCVFDGTGKELYETQYRVKEMRTAFNAEYRHIRQNVEKAITEGPSESKKYYTDFLTATTEVDQRLLKDINRLVNKAPGLTDTERTVLKANECYRLKNMFLENLAFQSSRGLYSGNRKVREAILEYYQNAFSTTDGCAPSSWPWQLSWAYADFAYFHRLVGLVLPIQVQDPTGNVKFSDLYSHIVTGNKGMLLDRQLAAAFLNFSSTREVPSDFYRQALETVSDPESARLIRTLFQNREHGAAGFPFRLPDTTGQYVSFSDFKDKVVVLDFWFTGCHGCLSLAKAMRPVYKHFKANPDVVFINISIDKNKDRWVESIRSGKYDYPGSIALYTEGRGDIDEIIRHYNILAYPTLIIFDRNGQVAFFNPTKPYKDGERADFIKRIETLL